MAAKCAEVDERLGRRPAVRNHSGSGSPGRETPRTRTDRWRSFPLAHFAPLAELPGVRLISLQTEHGLDQLRAADRRFPVIELPGRRCRDFMETAAIMTHLDLVITPDTARGSPGGRPRVCESGPASAPSTSGAGSPVATTPRGIPPCGCSVRPRSAIGTASSGGWLRRCNKEVTQSASEADPPLPSLALRVNMASSLLSCVHLMSKPR